MRIKNVNPCKLFRTEPGKWSVLNTCWLLLLFSLLMDAFSTNILPVLFSRRGIALISGLWLYRLMKLTPSSDGSFLQGEPSNNGFFQGEISHSGFCHPMENQGRVPTLLPGRLIARDAFVFIQERPVGLSKESGLSRDFRKELFSSLQGYWVTSPRSARSRAGLLRSCFI